MADRVFWAAGRAPEFPACGKRGVSGRRRSARKPAAAQERREKADSRGRSFRAISARRSEESRVLFAANANSPYLFQEPERRPT